MASVSASNAPLPQRKSFAQVAAAANIQITPREKPTNKSNQNSNAQSSPQIPIGISVARSDRDAKPTTNGENAAAPVRNQTLPISGEPPQLHILLQRVHLQDDQTTPPVADLIHRKEPDTKSVASRTTVTLDEKESLRPDDSASMQAALEEDTISRSNSVLAESRAGTDPDAKAFREQLNEIDRTGAAGPLPSQTLVALPIPPADPRNGGIIVYPAIPVATSAFDPAAATIAERPRIAPAAFVAPPDEKLLEALASPKDRLFVLKIEQDMIDFVKDPKEEFLQLPQTNSFYRMLSHKLADYYLLGHLVDESMTSVRVYRTPHSRLPPPLIGPASSGDGSTPPPNAPTRKIMRRMADQRFGIGRGTGDRRIFDSQNSSKTPSDTGAGSGGDDGVEENDKLKDKSALTREERENRYKEARARIFKDFKEEIAEPTEGAGGPTDKEVPRTSSASGMKKTKKSKKPKDDGFEARSAYSQYGSQTFQSNGLTSPASDSSFYNPFAPYALGTASGHSIRPQEPTLQGPHPGYASFGQHDPSGMSPWANGLPAQTCMMSPAPMSSYYGGLSGYEAADNVFSSPPPSYPSPTGVNQMTPKAAHQALAGYPTDYMAPGEAMGWVQGGFHNPYATNGMMCNSNGSAMPEHGYPSNQMMYNQMAAFDNLQTPDSHYFPAFAQNGFDRPQFNPRSQAFVPSFGGAMVSPMQAAGPGLTFVNTTPRPSSSAPLQRQVSNTSQNSGYGSFHFGQQSPNGARGNGQAATFRSQAQNARQTQAPFSSTISKWGNPSTLPPKPPPPASPYFEMPRDPQNQQQPLPPNPYSNPSRTAGGNDAGAQVAH